MLSYMCRRAKQEQHTHSVTAMRHFIDDTPCSSVHLSVALQVSNLGVCGSWYPSLDVCQLCTVSCQFLLANLMTLNSIHARHVVLYKMSSFCEAGGDLNKIVCTNTWARIPCSSTKFGVYRTYIY